MVRTESNGKDGNSETDQQINEDHSSLLRSAARDRACARDLVQSTVDHERGAEDAVRGGELEANDCQRVSYQAKSFLEGDLLMSDQTGAQSIALSFQMIQLMN